MQYRNRGIGNIVASLFESFLVENYRTELIKSGVQVTNYEGIRFWTTCGYVIGKEARSLDDGTTVYEMYKQLSW
jgi:ribosomal protein S18 acetylase RimI-like enzyme